MSFHLPIATPKSLRHRALGLLAVAVSLGSSAAALPAADAEAQMYKPYRDYQVQSLPDYQVTIDSTTTTQGRVYLTIANRGNAGTTTHSWTAVYDFNGTVTWLSVPGLAAGESWSTSVPTPDASYVCADDWGNYIVESDEYNNCREVSTSYSREGNADT